MKFSLARHCTIQGNREKVEEYLGDFHQWPLWSPWSVLEPTHKRSVTGEPRRKGHTMTWEGKYIGSGEMSVDSYTGKEVRATLRFLKPFASEAKTHFLIEELNGTETKVTWGMVGALPWFLWFLVPTMKSFMEMDFDRGLKMLKSVVETGKVPAITTSLGVKERQGFSYVGKEQTSSMEDLPKEMGKLFGELMMKTQSLTNEATQWIALYPKVNMKNKTFTYCAAASKEENDQVQWEGSKEGKVKSGKMLVIQHKGAYAYLGNAWSMGMMIMRTDKMKGNGVPFERYVNDPRTTPEEELITEVCFPIKG